MDNYGVARLHDVVSIEDRIKLIGRQVDKSQRDPWIRAIALDIVRGTPQHGPESEEAEVCRVFDFVKSNIEYRQDPRDYDYYATAKRTLQMRSGDCDDHCTLVAALLHNLGFRTGAKVVSGDGSGWHIYAVAGIRSRSEPSAIVPLDTTQPDSYPGWEPSQQFRRHELLVTFIEGESLIRRLR